MPLVNGRFVADMKSPRTPDNEEPAAERACDFRPVDKGFTEEMALAEAERCLNCKKPFCVEGCPVNINIPRFIEQIRAKDFGGALDTIREDSMLPAICGRVCPQENQCEGKCIRGKKSEPVAIGQLERVVGADLFERQRHGVALTAAGGSTKAAIVMLLAGVSAVSAANCLEAARGSVRQALVLAEERKSNEVKKNNHD